MREQVVDVPPQEVITKDNVVVTVDAIVYYEATDPVKLTYNVADFYHAPSPSWRRPTCATWSARPSWTRR